MSRAFAAELAQYGPGAPYPAVSPAQARAYCGRLARTHYENFTVASFLLPRALLPHFHNVYAYCRWADDLADETSPGEALPLLRWWREELLRCYHGQPRHPVMVALRETIERFQIPAKPFLDLLVAFEQDQLVKRYETYEQLRHYCRHSANPVGHLVLYLCRVVHGGKCRALRSRMHGAAVDEFLARRQPGPGYWPGVSAGGGSRALRVRRR